MACRTATTCAALAEIAANISATERRAMKAERETADRLIAHFLADRVGAIFDGHISGVTRAGLFVELDETGADGFIPARNIGEEYFRYHEASHAFVGGAATYRLGDPVTVELVEAAPVAGALRFKLVRDEHARAAAQRTGHPPQARKLARPPRAGGIKYPSARGGGKGGRQSRGRRTERAELHERFFMSADVIESGVAADRAERLTRAIRDQTFPI